jgi:hypothetical protein
VFNGFNQAFVADAINRSSESAIDRRRFLRVAGITGLGVAGVGALGATAGTAVAGAEREQQGPSDAAVLNFALNLEYLEAEFYLRAVFGNGLADSQIGGAGRVGPVSGGRKVPFATPTVRQHAEEIANDERAHVEFLRSALGDAKVARPQIDLDAAFSAAAAVAGLIRPDQRFDPFADENSFLLGAFVFEDLGVTAYRGALPLMSNRTFVDATAGILAAEAYHAGLVRSQLLAKGLEVPTGAISDARDSLDGAKDVDQGIVDDSGRPNILPTDGNGLAFSRTPAEVLNIVYLSPRPVAAGGFFPSGVNGEIARSDDRT